MILPWLALMLGIAGLPIILGLALPEVKMLLALLVLLSIYSTIRSFFGDGWTTILLTAAAAYYLVYKHFWTTVSLWWIFLLLGIGAFSAIGWTFITLTRFGQMLLGRRR